MTLRLKLLALVLAIATVHAAEEDEQRRNVTRIGFGSCHKNKRSTTPPIWDVIQQDKPDIWVWTGDAMYPSGRDPQTGKKKHGPAEAEEMQQGFADMKERNATIGYKSFLAHNKNLKVYGSWDDHDYGGNDSGNSMPNRKERRDVFWEFLGYRPHSHDGVYHSVDIENGKVKLVLLDTRWFRDDHCIPSVAMSKIPMGNAIACFTRWLTAGLYLHKFAWLWGMSNCGEKSFLGEEQWKWLEETLLEARRNDMTEAILVVSSVQVFTTNPSMESWGHFPKEQERLWNLLQHHYSALSSDDEDKSSAPIFFLSGDVHHGEISGQAGYVEITSSGLTHHCGEPRIYGGMCEPLLSNFNKHRHSQEEYYIGLNYGMIDFDFDAHTVAFHIKNNVGSTVLSYTQSLDSQIVELGSYNDLPHTWDGHLIPLFVLVLLCLIGGFYAIGRIRTGGESKKPKGE